MYNKGHRRTVGINQLNKTKKKEDHLHPVMMEYLSGLFFSNGARSTKGEVASETQKHEGLTLWLVDSVPWSCRCPRLRKL